ncbi:MAG: diaminopimelate epimerase [Terrimicrobiaceae bacterium]|nr:diaminopimelate epimerase [Terrimicrobiaceae bacterium]
MTLSFTKMNGAGNDFVLLDNRDASLALTREQIALLCDRHRGVGADGLLLVEPPQNGADFRMRYYNADGGEAEMCGNGARCFARYAQRITDSRADRISFETPAGVISAGCVGDEVQIAMSTPHSYAPPTALEAAGETVAVHFINTGVPHAVIFVDDLAAADVVRIGAAIRFHPHFAPAGTNVNFVRVDASGGISIRTYERGVEGETLACGTGVVACALIHHLTSNASSPVGVHVRGGDTLRVGFEPGAAPGEFRAVTLTGPADFVFDGTVTL